MSTNTNTSPILPALKATQALRDELKSRVGKPGGNLNKLLLSHLDTIESTLLQTETLGTMLGTINQQSEVAVHQYRQIQRMQLALPAANGDAHDLDDESSTKGQ